MSPVASSSKAKKTAEPDHLTALVKKARLPIGPQDLPEPQPNSQRERILDSLVAVCARKGYGAATVADIVGPAGVSRATFFELFEDKDDGLRAAMESFYAEGVGRVVAGYSPDQPWATMIRTAAASLLELLAERPDLAWMALIEVPAAGGKALEMYSSGKSVPQGLLDLGRGEPVDGEIPSGAARGAVAAAEALIGGQILAGNSERLPALLPDIVYIVTIPFVGQAEALRQAREAERSLAAKAR